MSYQAKATYEVKLEGNNFGVLVMWMGKWEKLDDVEQMSCSWTKSVYNKKTWVLIAKTHNQATFEKMEEIAGLNYKKLV